MSRGEFRAWFSEGTRLGRSDFRRSRAPLPAGRREWSQWPAPQRRVRPS